MANQNILTTASKTVQAKQSYYAPAVYMPSSTTVKLSNIYCFLSRAVPWNDEENPPIPTQDQSALKTIFKNMFAVKSLTSNDISPVIERKDWSTGTIYDYYQDDVDMLESDINGFLVYDFYVKNKYDQVFKCLWNNEGAASTVEPYFEPGTFTSNYVFTGADGYKWKYIYTIDISSKVKFMDSEWMPVPVGNRNPNPLVASAGYGNIDVINVTNGGSSYDTSNASVIVTITGDGTGAAATAVVENGNVTNIVVTNAGSNYTYANVAITSALGSGALAFAPISPVGGHGYDPISELGCSHVMYTCQLNGSEGGEIPTDIDYHQIGLLVNPTSLASTPNPANGSVYRTTTDFVVAAGLGTYSLDETVYQGPSLAESTFSGTVLSFDVASNTIRLINTTGTPVLNNPVYGDISKTARNLLTISSPNFTLFSGHIIYVENRAGVQRSADGIEQLKFVLGY